MQRCTANYICEDVVERGEVFEMNAQIKKQEGVTPKEATPSGRYAQPTTTPSQPNATLRGQVTGYAYDLMCAYQVLTHIQSLTGTDLSQYHKSLKAIKTETPLFNVTATNWHFIAIGFRAHSGNVGFPVLARNVVTGDWLWSRDLVWYEKENGFVWSGGNYVSEKEARAQFEKECDGIVFYTEAY